MNRFTNAFKSQANKMKNKHMERMGTDNGFIRNNQEWLNT